MYVVIPKVIFKGLKKCINNKQVDVGNNIIKNTQSKENKEGERKE